MRRSDPRPAAPRRGLTLIELLVVGAVIALAVVLFVNYVDEGREPSRRTQCINNLKGIGLALHEYAEAWGGFPPAANPIPVATPPGYVSTAFNPAPHVALLPYLEQASLYAALNIGVPMADPADLRHANSTVAHARLGIFACPSDPKLAGNNWAGSSNSYRANLGPCAHCDQEGRGALVAGTITPLASFTDGTSQTLAVAERLLGSTPGRFDPARDWIDTHATARLRADDWLQLAGSGIDPGWASFGLGQTWLIAGGMQTHVFTALTPNAPVPDCGSSAREGGFGAISARSAHPGGVEVLLADGAVQFIRTSIALPVWRALGTRATDHLPEPMAY